MYCNTHNVCIIVLKILCMHLPSYLRVRTIERAKKFDGRRRKFLWLLVSLKSHFGGLQGDIRVDLNKLPQYFGGSPQK